MFLTPLISRPKPEKHRERAHSHPWRARTHTRNTTVTAVCFLPATPSSGCTHHNCQRITNTDSPFSTHSVWSCTGAPSATNGLYELLIAGRVSGGWRSSARFLISSLKSHSEKTGSWRLSFFPPHHRHHHKEKKKQLKGHLFFPFSDVYLASRPALEQPHMISCQENELIKNMILIRNTFIPRKVRLW